MTGDSNSILLHLERLTWKKPLTSLTIVPSTQAYIARDLFGVKELPISLARRQFAAVTVIVIVTKTMNVIVMRKARSAIAMSIIMKVG